MKAIQFGGQLKQGEPERLNDATKAALRVVINEAKERTPEVMAAETRLEMDHDQAREDVKRLAGALQARVNDCCVSGSRCIWCVRDLALLAEVDP